MPWNGVHRRDLSTRIDNMILRIFGTWSRSGSFILINSEVKEYVLIRWCIFIIHFKFSTKAVFSMFVQEQINVKERTLNTKFNVFPLTQLLAK